MRVTCYRNHEACFKPSLVTTELRVCREDADRAIGYERIAYWLSGFPVSMISFIYTSARSQEDARYCVAFGE